MMIDELLLRWEEAREQGRPLAVEGLCADCPELADELQRRIQALSAVDKVLEAAELLPASAATQLHAVGNTPSGDATHADQREIPRRFGDYELLSQIARGGMGVVYKARQVKLNRIVALKMILAGAVASDDDVRRFYTEAEAAAGLQHPGIVAVHEVGEHHGQHFFSMEFVEGTSLAERLRDGPLPVREAAEIVRQAAEAMHYAHQNGVIHRDLKPGTSC
jgi:serine/threonine-protein kinase